MSPNTPSPSAPPAAPANNSVINTEVKSFFDPKEEKAACGVGFIVNIDGIASHKVINHLLSIVSLSIVASCWPAWPISKPIKILTRPNWPNSKATSSVLADHILPPLAT